MPKKFYRIDSRESVDICIIVFVWSQCDGGNIEQRTIGYGCRQNQEAKLKIVGGVIKEVPHHKVGNFDRAKVAHLNSS